MFYKYFVVLFLIGLSYGQPLYLNVTEYFRMPPLFELDNYEKCMASEDGMFCVVAVDVITEPDNDVTNIITKYSANRLKRFNHSNIERGICVTSSCRRQNIHNLTMEDLKIVLSECINKTIYNEYKVETKLSRINYCHNSKRRLDQDFDNGDQIFAIAVFIIVLLNIIGTWYDARLTRTNESKGNPHLLCFSIIKNWSKYISNEHKDPRFKSFQGLHAIKTILTFLIVMVHVLWLYPFTFVDNPRDLELNYDKLSYQMLFNGASLMQVYFMMSGCLLVHSLKISGEHHAETWTMFPLIIIYRLGRVLPAIMMILGFTTTWFRHLGNGPLWNYYVSPAVSDCRQYWWSHLLFVNILLPDTENRACILQSWHISAEIHLFTISLFIYLATRKRFRSLAFTIMFLIGLVGPALHVWFKDVEATLLIYPEFIRKLMSDEFRNVHSKPYNNMSAYVIGMCLGLYIYEAQRSNKKFNKSKLLSVLTLMVIPTTFLLFSSSGYYFFARNGQSPILGRMIYAAAHRPALALVYAFLVLSLVFDFNNFLSTFANWSAWRLPSRLTYMVYIVHITVIQYLLGSRTQLDHVAFMNIVMSVVGVSCISFLLALPLYLLLEAPFTNLVKTLAIGDHSLSSTKQDSKKE
ncbi:nose resistant to fluoxetine protein 6-like isoform X2 [Leptidea sinapis]|uniref:nose resistant to fluoxetine protein 6-like isoform X2 n=1 Tax=Leptidea sinapis TaxID=189913 RepID=UPI00212BACED|nr:nose resistant to fluoxetine protein 6-like isoform X2 [Leptidea sinapis]